MGAWGNGPFENDDALDLIGDLADSERPLAGELQRMLDPASVPRPSWLARLLNRQPEDEFDGVNDFTMVAAAGVVAAALGLDVGNTQVTDLLAKKPLAVSADLREAAKAVLARATGSDSEWFELWQESGASSTRLRPRLIGSARSSSAWNPSAGLLMLAEVSAFARSRSGLQSGSAV